MSAAELAPFRVGMAAPANANRNLTDGIDTSLSEGLRAEGFFDAMRKKYGVK